MRPTMALILGVCLLAGCQHASSESAIAGVWQGKDSFGQTMRFTLESDGALELHVSNDRNSFTKVGHFTVDFSQQPAHFNVELRDRKIETIIEQVDETHLAFENINSSDDRPMAFGPQRIVLQRQ